MGNLFIQQLIEVSRHYGQNPDYIIAGGGNTSFKSDENIWIKASGSSLADIDENGFVCLARKNLKILSTKKYSSNSSERENQVKQDLANAILFPKDKRPSVETSMHEVIQFPFVVHTHPTLVNGLLCAKNSQKKVSELFGKEVLYIEYTDPGYILFKSVDNALKNFRNKTGKEPSIIFLENHGIFVGAESIKEIYDTYSEIEKTLKSNISSYPITSKSREEEIMLKAIKKLAEYNETKNLKSIILSNNFVDQFITSYDAFKKINIPFTPDNIVYCKSNYLFVSNTSEIISDILDFNQRHGYLPKVVAIKGHGIICLEETRKSAQIVADVFEDMMKVSFLTDNFGGSRPMTQSQIDFIDNWEVENYRRQVSKSN